MPARQPGEYKHNRQQNCKNAQSGHDPVPQFDAVNSSSNEGISMPLENSPSLDRVPSNKKSRSP
jgi:hypothetical protein